MLDSENLNNNLEENTDEEMVSTPSRSRINRVMEHQAKRNILVMAAGIIFVICLLAFFGVTALQKLSDITVKNKDATDTQQKVDTTVILPPSLEAPVEATNSADIRITGQAQNADEVKLYDNNVLIQKTTIKKDGTFEFSDVTLKDGNNTLKAKAVKNTKESDYSQEVQVNLYSKPPSLTISSPADGRSFSHDENPILVSGKTDANVSVFVNDRQAIIEPDGTFKYTYTLSDGSNDIKVVAKDPAGNQTEQKVTVTLH